MFYILLALFFSACFSQTIEVTETNSEDDSFCFTVSGATAQEAVTCSSPNDKCCNGGNTWNADGSKCGSLMMYDTSVTCTLDSNGESSTMEFPGTTTTGTTTTAAPIICDNMPAEDYCDCESDCCGTADFCQCEDAVACCANVDCDLYDDSGDYISSSESPECEACNTAFGLAYYNDCDSNACDGIDDDVALAMCIAMECPSQTSDFLVCQMENGCGDYSEDHVCNAPCYQEMADRTVCQIEYAADPMGMLTQCEDLVMDVIDCQFENCSSEYDVGVVMSICNDYCEVCVDYETDGVMFDVCESDEDDTSTMVTCNGDTITITTYDDNMCGGNVLETMDGLDNGFCETEYDDDYVPFYVEWTWYNGCGADDYHCEDCMDDPNGYLAATNSPINCMMISALMATIDVVCTETVEGPMATQNAELLEALVGVGMPADETFNDLCPASCGACSMCSSDYDSSSDSDSGPYDEICMDESAAYLLCMMADNCTNELDLYLACLMAAEGISTECTPQYTALFDCEMENEATEGACTNKDELEDAAETCAMMNSGDACMVCQATNDASCPDESDVTGYCTCICASCMNDCSADLMEACADGSEADCIEFCEGDMAAGDDVDFTMCGEEPMCPCVDDPNSWLADSSMGAVVTCPFIKSTLDGQGAPCSTPLSQSMAYANAALYAELVAMGLTETDTFNDICPATCEYCNPDDCGTANNYCSGDQVIMTLNVCDDEKIMTCTDGVVTKTKFYDADCSSEVDYVETQAEGTCSEDMQSVETVVSCDATTATFEFCGEAADGDVLCAEAIDDDVRGCTQCRCEDYCCGADAEAWAYTAWGDWRGECECGTEMNMNQRIADFEVSWCEDYDNIADCDVLPSTVGLCPGTTTTTEEPIPCTEGTFSDNGDGNAPCSACKTCDADEREDAACSLSADTQCSERTAEFETTVLTLLTIGDDEDPQDALDVATQAFANTIGVAVANIASSIVGGSGRRMLAQPVTVQFVVTSTSQEAANAVDDAANEPDFGETLKTEMASVATELDVTVTVDTIQVTEVTTAAVACTAGTDFSTSGNSPCTPCLSCTASQTETTACTLTADTVCTDNQGTSDDDDDSDSDTDAGASGLMMCFALFVAALLH